ncbi:MAG: hypothetical protein SOI41_01125 [Heyndrickxia coagulans]|jgi:hypothetical protein|uniref:hypothetical protein n=1 Tax=Heyndrickxia coagulans TaxID=1398 RepID=UPI002F3CB6F8
MISKKAELLFEGAVVTAEYSQDSNLVTILVTELGLSEEKSTLDQDVYEEKNKCEVYLDSDELGELIQALVEIKSAAERGE